MAESKTKKIGVWNCLNRIQGDKVIWIIVIMLILYSIVAIFDSSTLLAIMEKTTRLAIFKKHMIFVGLGVLIIFACYFIPNIGWFRGLSQFGFGVSAIMLMMLLLHISAAKINGEYRALKIGGFQLQVYEFVKVGMILYLSWAVNTYMKDGFTIVNRLSRRFKSLAFLAKPVWKRIVYIHFPIIFVTLCISAGSGSSAMFILALMILTILVGGLPVKDIIIMIVFGVTIIASSYALYKVSDGKVFGRWETWEARIIRLFNPVDPSELEKGTEAWDKYIAKNGQPIGARVAVKEGGLIGKGPGKSTQKYSVALLFSDFMFSFIVESYGLLFGALPLIILYVSLLARGSIIVKSCNNLYAKTVVAGLTLMISGQAMMHMFVNVGLGPLTGQTLPMISHGNSSFLAFCIAFGVLLSISKMAKKKVEQQAAQAAPIVAHSDDEIRSSLDDLDRLESIDDTEPFAEK